MGKLELVAGMKADLAIELEVIAIYENALTLAEDEQVKAKIKDLLWQSYEHADFFRKQIALRE